MQKNKTINKIIEYLFRNPNTTRVDLHKYLDISPAAVTKLVKQLIDSDFIVETGDEISQSTGAGRNKQIISLNKRIGNYIGVSFTLEGLGICLCDLMGGIISKNFIDYIDLKEKDLNNLIISEIIKLKKAKISNLPILGVGFAIPGHFDSKNSKLISNNPMWNNFDLNQIQQSIKLPVIADNNVESMADAKYLFNSKNLNEKFIFLNVGYGIYSAFIEPDNLHPKNNYSVGEIGHSVVKLNGFKCECGKNGCLQTYISESWLIKRAKLLYNLANNTVLLELVKNIDQIDLDAIFKAYKLNDPYIVNMLDEGIDYLGISISNLLMIYDADTIYINSPILQSEYFHDKLLNIIHNQLKFINTKKATKVHILKYDKYRGAIGGCALVALAEVIKNPYYQSIK